MSDRDQRSEGEMVAQAMLTGFRLAEGVWSGAAHLAIDRETNASKSSKPEKVARDMRSYLFDARDASDMMLRALERFADESD